MTLMEFIRTIVMHDAAMATTEHVTSMQEKHRELSERLDEAHRRTDTLTRLVRRMKQDDPDAVD